MNSSQNPPDRSPEKTAQPAPSSGSSGKITRRSSPAARRNRDAIRTVFLEHMPASGTVLEVASGSGEHAIHLAAACPDLTWIASDPDEDARQSISGWLEASPLPNIRGPLAIDVRQDDWGADFPATLDGMVAINLIHISPIDATQGLIRGAAQRLHRQGRLFLYGPYSRNGIHTSQSNEAFDASLKSRDPQWGVRDLENDIIPLCEQHGLVIREIVAMPANNFSVIIERVP